MANTDSVSEVWPKSLRFKIERREVLFRDSRAGSLRFRVQIMAVSILGASVWQALNDAGFQETHAGERAFAAKATLLGVWSGWLAILVLLIFVLRKRNAFAEPVAVIGLFPTSFMITISRPDMVCILLGTPDECYDPAVFKNIFMRCTILAAILFTGLPIRCIWNSVLAIGILSPPIASCVVRPNSLDAEDCLFFFWAVLLMFHGARLGERHYRMSFAGLIDEKNLRVATEFKLEQAHTAKEGPKEHELESRPETGVESRPETGVTGRLFQSVARGDTTSGALTDLVSNEQLVIKPESLQLVGTLLGKGGQGIVIEGRYASMRVAIKIPRMSDLAPRQLDMLNELRFLRKVRHPNIVQFFGVCSISCGFLVVLEFIDGLTLTAYTVAGFGGRPPGSQSRVQSITGVVAALAYLHSRDPRIVHGDIKPDNIRVIEQVGEHRKVVSKLLDFGLARTCTRNAKASMSTIRYAAPEQFADPPVKAALSSDVFAVGRLMFFVATRQKPFRHLAQEMVLHQMRRNMCAPLAWGELSETPWVEIKHTAEECMSFDPEQRPPIFHVSQDLQKLEQGEALEITPTDANPEIQLVTAVEALQAAHDMELEIFWAQTQADSADKEQSQADLSKAAGHGHRVLPHSEVSRLQGTITAMARWPTSSARGDGGVQPAAVMPTHERNTVAL